MGGEGTADMAAEATGNATQGLRGVEAPDLFRCDFCGDEVQRVRRVALDRDYDRLQADHLVRYACETCSEQKERRRLGL